MRPRSNTAGGRTFPRKSPTCQRPPPPKTKCPLWSLPGPWALVHLAGAAGLGGRRQALNYLSPSCPRPWPDITERGRGGGSQSTAQPLTWAASQPLALRRAQPGALVRLGAQCRLSSGTDLGPLTWRSLNGSSRTRGPKSCSV